MSVGRPTKRKSFNFQQQGREEVPALKHEGNLDESLSSRPMREARLRSMKKIAEAVTNINNYQSEENLQKMRCLVRKRRATELSEDRSKRLEILRKRASQSRANETEEHRHQRLEDKRNREVRRRANETEERRSQRLEDKRNREVRRRANETEECRSQRLEDKRNREVRRRANETEECRSQRLEDKRNREVRRRANETEERRSQRLEDKRNREVRRRADETKERRFRRLEDKRQRESRRRASESSELRDERLEEQRRRNARRKKALEQNRLPTYKCAVDTDVSYQSLGNFDVICTHCEALHFPEERVSNQIGRDSFSQCCLHGRIELDQPKFPNELVRLFLRIHPLSDEFHKRIRNLNACFALASFNMDDDRTINSHGFYTFVAAGQIYHKMNMAAHPTQNDKGEFERPQYGQMYFLEPDDAVTERINHPLNHGISRLLIELLERIIRTENRFAQGFMMMREVEEKVNQHASKKGIAPPHVGLLFTLREGADYRRFNIPVINDVCAVITLNADQSFPENEMVVHQRGKEIITLKNTDERVEPFTYPLFYPKGTPGWSLHLPLRKPYTSRQHLTRLEMAQYRIAFRNRLIRHLPHENAATDIDLRETMFNALHFGGRLFQQYLVDTYIRVERDRIQWIKANQKKILADNYTGVTHFINELSEKKNASVGEKIILPSSFPGSTRFFTECFEDAMAIVRRKGPPHFFVTATFNPECKEMKEACKIVLANGTDRQQQPQDRPDLVARLAKLKFEELIKDFENKQIFGKVAAYVYAIEFQKRGLPHMHLLLIMSPEDKIRNTEELDDLISAEIPEDYEDPELRELVIKWMIHNPCGELNPESPCMVNKNGKMKCRFNFPKDFQQDTSIADDEKPKYRRRYDPRLDERNPDFCEELAVFRKTVNGKRVTRDNRHVVPYNAYLLKKYNCHINVEYVGSIRAVKYLYKYIYKGHDCASIKIVENQRKLIYNEADAYVEGRCITPPEACWRLFENEIQKKSHVVQRLDIHLPGQYRVGNIDQTHEDLADIGQKGSTLEAYFRHNQVLKQKENRGQSDSSTDEVIYHYYWQMPEHFKWVGKSSEWLPRVRKLRVIGRIHNVNIVAQPELYHLRLLLYHVKNATNFDDLLAVEGIQYSTYKQACLARGLTYDDRQWVEGLRESAISKMPRAMRTLFTQILILGSPENPKRLWEMFKEDLALDFILEARRTGGSVEDAINRAYKIIAHKLNTEATEGRNFRYWVDKFGMNDIDGYYNEINQANFTADESTALGQNMYCLLQGRQIEIVDAILRAADDSSCDTRCFFIDGPGGTGKTFVYKTLYHILRGRNRNVKCMAFTGIASILLPEGRTSHRTLGLRVPLTSEAVSNIKPGTAKATELANVDVFLMDEAPMLPKYGLNNMDQLLRAIGNKSLPFGGKIVVLGGDFRQCLPVQPRANKSELLDLCITKSDVWHHFKIFSLTKNMRVDPEEQEFAEYLLQLGNGELPTNSLDEIELPEDILSNGNLIEEVFGNCIAAQNFEAMKDRAILAPLNADVSKINSEIIERLPGESILYYSFDSVKDQPEGALEFTPEFLNTVDIADLPPHELKLKTNTIIMLLRNLDVSEGLCNGTRLIVTDLCNNIIKAKIITGENFGRVVHIPRITLDSSKGQLGCTMQRHQFPVRPAFAITVHKAQGQTFDFVGVDLSVSVFMHGMLYVAFSRVKRRSGLKVLIPKESNQRTKNVVWKDVLSL